jgi:hypothetical protein
VSSECKNQWLDRTLGNFAASAAFTSATVATSADFSSLREMGKPRKSVDLPVAVMVSELIARYCVERVGTISTNYLFMLIYSNPACLTKNREENVIETAYVFYRRTLSRLIKFAGLLILIFNFLTIGSGFLIL